MNVTGKIKQIYDTVTYDSGFSKREFVVTTNEQYPQDIKMELVKDKCALLNNYSEGDEVTVDINLRGNEYNGKYYVNIQAWRIGSNSTDGNEVIAQAARDKALRGDMANQFNEQQEEDSLPF